MWVYHVSHHQLNSHHLPKTIHILNIVRYHAVGSLTSMCVYHVSHHQCSLSSSSVKVTRLCFSRSRRYIRREKKGCTVLSLPPTRHSTGIFCEKNGQICFTKQQKAKRKTINLWNDGNDKRQNRKADLQIWGPFALPNIPELLQVQCCFTPTETIRMGGAGWWPQLFTQLLSSAS